MKFISGIEYTFPYKDGKQIIMRVYTTSDMMKEVNKRLGRNNNGTD